MSGFVTIHRRMCEHPLFEGDADRFGAWIWLIANAAWKSTTVRIKGSTVQLDRGELSFSVRFLAAKWGWSKSRVDRFIADLRAEGMITTRSKIGTTAGHSAGQGQSILTVCNYAKYQDRSDRTRDNDGAESGTRAGQQRDKEEQGNKVSSLSNDNDAEFSDRQFWASARAYLGSGKGSLIGKWCKEHGQPATARAITEAQLNRAAEPVAYIERTLRRAKAGAEELPIC